MSFSISRAARETGLSKSTISRAVKTGRVSATKQDDGSYLIDPAELFRVYPKGGAQPVDDARHDAVRNPHEEGRATPYAETEILRVRLEMTQQMLERERENVEDLRKRLDAATNRVLELTKVAQPGGDASHDAVRNRAQPPVWQGLWDRLRGR